jgi:hypothetical protein
MDKNIFEKGVKTTQNLKFEDGINKLETLIKILD